MGINIHQVHNVVHYGIPRELETFVQQMGRGGRDGKPSHELVLFKAHKGYLKHVEPELVRIVKDNSVCRRNILCNAFQTKHYELTPLHACCDVCEKKCKCQLDTCPESHVAMKDDDEGGSSGDEMERNVSVEERRLLTQKLESLQFTLSDRSSGGLLNSELVHGFTKELVKDMVSKCHVLFTAEDIMQKFPIWSFCIAQEICKIILDVFGDETMYNLVDSDSSTSEN
ncbi:putative ATP-dependent DNA helicase Q1 [Saccostrea echinata]|uniref:putative ATP-dependent DNA helicase Q1 n=1 Tax=Saccostrea echinata TaxID=191078 RepID=UPI002A805B18|nr:putative ATP-dependent DNA helicase Q1 [Saccostrea echinata]